MRNIKFFIILLLAVCLVGCGSKEEEHGHEHEYEKGICECGEIKTGYYKVKYNTDGGSKIEPTIVKKGDVLSEPNNPTKDGFIFIGWYIQDELFDFKSEINKNITLTAKWHPYDGFTPVLLADGTHVRYYNDYNGYSSFNSNVAISSPMVITAGSSGIFELNISNRTSESIRMIITFTFDYDFFEFSIFEDFSIKYNDPYAFRIDVDLAPGENINSNLYWRWPLDNADALDGDGLLGSDVDLHLEGTIRK